MICPECKSNHIILKGSDTICTDCGLVINENRYVNGYAIIIDSDKNHKACHYGSINNEAFINIGTMIGYSNKILEDYNRKPLSGKALAKYIKLRERDFRAKINGIHNEYRALNILNDVGRYFQLPIWILSTAGVYYKKIVRNERDNIINHTTLIGTCIFMAIRMNKQNFTVSQKKIIRFFETNGWHITSHLISRDALIYNKYFPKNMFLVRKPEHYLSKYVNMIICSNLIIDRIYDKGFSENIDEYGAKLLNISLKIINNIPFYIIQPRDPAILASSIIYMADIILAEKNNHKQILTQEILAECLNIPKCSLREVYQKVLKGRFKACKT